ncbi:MULTISPECIES: N-acetylmuramoyl-L-alanine amidase [Streptomycetaceae]|uniref:N-acetylmuramoyl-L-alanine amidase n=1 Tax=Streptantibioticus cattleyicolor (strain ATCC 35852 / DSM 46488 / JCM 4925 / NBRC 14057 / NRRL 8057) TaxID=1003195 RepID=F8K3B0_STREN|nr:MULTISPECIES: peptidoglycan recognition family protein [Streptomycetaceae]AEW95021.1 amidase [Streptantibioticus cattleyicolor NRRL 8057 = DSM 46488]MYS59622.1 N-acetylmuramoyl-L-alanine amidase [Streptomyces sp. SID5468]CCB75374.1 Amidase [Streptantibioticus cattleyicolor NRRL 8057 = DSM 46488]
MDEPEEHRPTRRRLVLAGLALGGAAAAAGIVARRSAGAAPSAQGHGHPAAGSRSGAVDFAAASWRPASTANYTAADRPHSHPIDLVVVHVTQETFDNTIRVFQDPAHAATAHYVVRSADGRVAQCVRERDIAWHAGNWAYNTRSVGIEHEGWVDRPEFFTDAMYRASAALTAGVCARYGIPRDRDHIIGHSQVPGTDHTDPGPGWDWARYLRLVNSSGR